MTEACPQEIGFGSWALGPWAALEVAIETGQQVD
ncbi:protein of unknown function [Candidatus Bipolaricaulis anaerobius]|uniref:Uncharacterized protein n=1 Tax=Candidatus Bipolaricaulis anaerobius TaxID=2026885 RepID=A0A2X3KYZ4_9BACT|nr:protein of unknown function [Candidatus Bipolaricaulis anaerobius]